MWSASLFSGVFLGLVALTFGISESELTVTIPSLGVVRGSKLTTAVSKREVAGFTGIPYGSIPARFSPASLRDSLTADGSVFDATKPQVACQQLQLPGLEAGNFTEDCLTLNVYTPKTKTSQPLPVLVFIHGGSFIRWSGNLFDGRRLLDRDVVVVTINYRLNIFGFFCLENDDAPGNLGLYDQVLSLQWVQKHIRAFGGDPNSVTIAGQSAGGASVTYLLSSPLAAGLFHKAISSSGDDLAGWTVELTPMPDALAAAQLVGCANASLPVQNPAAILACMRAAPVDALLAATAIFYSAPVIQSFNLSIPKVVPTNPYQSLATGYANTVPLMIGSNKNDGSFLLSRTYTSVAPSGLLNSPSFLKQTFVTSLLTSSSFGIVDTPIGIIDSLTNQYLGSSKNSGNFTAMAPGLIDLFSVFYFKAPLYRTAKSLAPVTDVYLYSFDYFGTQTLYPFTGGVPQVPRGVAHVDDLMYVFFFGEFTKSEDKFISKLMVDHWVNFATTGNPNRRYVNIPPIFELWPKFKIDDERFLKVNLIPTVGTDYRAYWVDASRNIQS